MNVRTASIVSLAAFAIGTAAHATTVSLAVYGTDGQPAPNVVVELVPAHAQPFKPSATPVVIAQKDIHFVPYLTAIPVGTTVRFSNQDPYDHHLRSEPGGPFGNVPPAKEFEMRLAAANGDKIASADVKFDKPGVVVLGCHIHGSMRGHLFVSESPFVAVTDANGQAQITDVPEGSIEMRTWSPEQLTEQPVVAKQVAGPVASFATTLNFTPPKPHKRHG